MGVPQRKPEVSLPRHSLDGVETAFYVWKARPLSEFPRYQRWIIRMLSTLFGWSCGDSMEGLCIVRTAEEAQEIAWHFKGGNAQEFPVAKSIAESLPDKIVQFGRRVPGNTEGERFYAKHPMPMVAVPRTLIDEAAKVVSRTRPT